MLAMSVSPSERERAAGSLSPLCSLSVGLSVDADPRRDYFKSCFIHIHSLWRGSTGQIFLVFQSAKVHFGVHLKMEKSLPNPIALGPRATTQETWRVLAEQKERRQEETQTLTEWRQLQMSK